MLHQLLRERARKVEAISVLQVQHRANSGPVATTEAAIGIKMGQGNVPHLYIQAGDLRFDGEIFPKLPIARYVPPGHYDPGLVILSRDLPPEIFESIYKTIERELTNGPRPTISCITGGCKILNEAGIQIEGGTPYIPARALEAIFQKPLIKPDGTPVEFELLEISIMDMGPANADQLVEGASQAQHDFLLGGKGIKLVARQLGIPKDNEFLILGLVAAGGVGAASAIGAGSAFCLVWVGGKYYLMKLKEESEK